MVRAITPWSSKRRRVDPNSHDAEVSEEARAIQAEIDQLDADLREMENPSDGRTFIEPMLAELPEEHQQRIRKQSDKMSSKRRARKGRRRC